MAMKKTTTIHKSVKTKRYSEFRCRSATIHFIYSFVLSSKNSLIIDPLKIFNSKLLKENCQNMGIDLPSSRQGIIPHLSLKTNSCWLEYPSLEGNIKNKIVNIERLVRIFSTGGTCCFTIGATTDNMKSEDVLDILGVINQQFGNYRTERLGISKNKYDSLYQLFDELIDEITNIRSLYWLEQKQRLFRPTEDGKRKDYQSPWVVTLLEVEGDIEKTFCTSFASAKNGGAKKLDRIREYEKDIAPILFRSVSEEFYLEPAYLDPFIPGGMFGLSSINLDARLWVNLSRRSILCICPDKTKDPARYFLPDLLNLCELIRARWHSLIIMNKVIDNTLGVTSKQKHYSGYTTRKTLMSIREWLATSMEDPALYFIAGDALTKIHRDLMETFCIEELQNILISKMEFLERVYRDAGALRWMEIEKELGENDN